MAKNPISSDVSASSCFKVRPVGVGDVLKYLDHVIEQDSDAAPLLQQWALAVRPAIQEMKAAGSSVVMKMQEPFGCPCPSSVNNAVEAFLKSQRLSQAAPEARLKTTLARFVSAFNL